MISAVVIQRFLLGNLQRLIFILHTASVGVFNFQNIAMLIAGILRGIRIAVGIGHDDFFQETFLAVFDGVPTFEVAKDKFPLPVIELLAGESQVFPSKGECRKMIQANGVSINKEKVADINALIGEESFINGKYILAQKGKKNYFIIKILR